MTHECCAPVGCMNTLLCFVTAGGSGGAGSQTKDI